MIGPKPQTYPFLHISSTTKATRHRPRCRHLTRFEKILLGIIALLLTVVILLLLFVTHARIGAASSQLPAETLSPQSSKPASETQLLSQAADTKLSGCTIIVDAGHGGSDRGCTGVSGCLEKEINLEIAKRLQGLLEHEGVHVIMTRKSDDALAPTKAEDMATRVRIIEEADADAFISIHQNQFPEDDTVAGPQVFYAYQGTAGKKLATAVQEALNSSLKPTSPRMALDVPYDLLQPGSQPSCIVECGFFSNAEEETLLQTAEYQQKLAQAIVEGLRTYCQQAGK